MIKQTKKEKEENKQIAIDKLKDMLKKGQTIYTSLKGVSSSGMSRKISLYVVADGQIEDITWLVGRALGYSQDQKTGGLKVSGAGMDMGFAVVNSLNYKIFDDGYATIQRWL
jgi:hypothetical protein